MSSVLFSWLLLGGCIESYFSQLTTVDVFQQNRRNTVDLLLVVDNSCSMIEEQKKLAENFDSFITYFDGADVDWQLGVVTTDLEQAKFQGRLIGGDDEILLAKPAGTVIDRVEYDHDWAVAPGMAYALDPSWYDGVHNDKAERWCAVALGTPGAENPACTLDQGAGADDAYGEVIVTEFMPDPDAVADDLGEWVELTNVSDAEVDLSDWTLSDDGKNAYAFPDGASIEAGATLVLARSDIVTENGGIEAAYAVGTDFTLNNDVLLLSDETEGPSEIFQEMVAQGISGSGLEMGLEAVYRALSDELRLLSRNTGVECDPEGEGCGDPDETCEINDGTASVDSEYVCFEAPPNFGLVRDDANLSILVVSDEQDSSPSPVDEYLRAYADTKGDAAYRDHTVMNVSAVVGADPPPFEGEPSCSSINGEADYGSRYVDAVYKTGGLVDSICDEDFSPLVSQLGLTLSGLLAEFTLSSYPDLDTLEVGLYATNDENSKIRDLVLDVDFTYVEERNSIRFEYEQVPESEQYVEVVYKVRSGP